MKSLKSVSKFYLFPQFRIWAQAAEQPIGIEHFPARDIYPRWLATACYHEQKQARKHNLSTTLCDKMRNISGHGNLKQKA